MQIPPLAARPLSQTATPGPGTAPHVKPDPRDAAALKAAKAFEASFLEEMLKESGINSMPEILRGRRRRGGLRLLPDRRIRKAPG